jgi:mono/diheme cytochrome c family protein
MSPRLALALPPACAVLLVSPSSAPRAQDASGGISAVEVSTEGHRIYQEICQACHMADARGGRGAGAGVPALANNPRLADKAFAIEVVVKGRGGMPWFTDILTSQQIAAVLTYVRSGFNSYADPVTRDDVELIAGEAGATSEE